MLLIPPEPGTHFTVPGQPNVLTVSAVIARFEAPERDASMYLVETADGSRWLLLANANDDGLPWIGVPPRSETP